MAESLTLTAPVTKPVRASIRLQTVTLHLGANPSVVINWVGDDGEPGTASYPTPSVNGHPTGAAIIGTINKVNASGANASVVARLLARLQTDGYLPAGAITGTPD